MKKVLFVCLGNICRSPMAEFVMKELTDAFYIESRATSSWEEGNPIYQGTLQVLKQHQIPYDIKKRSQQIQDRDFEAFDYIIGMDQSNVTDLKKLAPRAFQGKIHPFATESVPDPWYTGDFDQTYRLVVAGCKDWVRKLRIEVENEEKHG